MTQSFPECQITLAGLEMDKGLLHFVLCDTRYPGNIGSTARAMKNFGFANLVLLNPRQRGLLDSLRMAGGAVDVIEKATIVGTLREAGAGVEHAVGFSRRIRDLKKPVVAPEEFRELLNGPWRQRRVALLFGSEKFGLSNAQIQLCERIVTIPTSPDSPSLNLAHAVAILCYELAARLGPRPSEDNFRDIVPMEHRELLYLRLQALLRESDFFKRRDPEKGMMAVREIFERSGLDSDDYNILMGIAKALGKKRGGEQDPSI